ncbi:hypothetical protein F5878DRAFT_132483, partial [Lentinula raphanica]
MTGSDHVGIHWRYDPGQAQIQNPLGVKYSLKKVKPAEWKEAFDEEVGRLGAKLNPITESVTVTRDQLDDAAEAFTEAMQKATEKVAKARRPSPHAKPWWDETCTAALNRVRRAQRDARRYRMENGFADPELKKVIKHEDNHYHRLVKFKKGSWATKTIEEAHPDDMWGFRKWSK